MPKRLLASLFLVLGLGSLALSEAKVKLAVVPFETEATEEFTRQRDRLMELLSSRLAHEKDIELLEKGRLTKELVDTLKQELTPGTVVSLAKELGLDFVVYGTLRRVGDHIAVDARLMKVKETKKRLSFFMETETFQGLDPRLGELARAISTYALEELGPEVTQAEKGPVILGVSFQGLVRLTRDRLLGIIQSKEGTVFTRERLQEDLARLKALGEIADVKAVLRSSPEGIQITFRLQEKEAPAVVGRLAKIAFVGLKGLTEERLRAAIKSKIGDPFSEEAIARDLEALRQLKEIERANVDIMDSEEGKEVFFVIKEKEQPAVTEEKKEEKPALAPPEERIRKITVTGNRVIDSAAIRATIKSKVGDLFSPDLVREDIKAIFKMGSFDDVKVAVEETKIGKELTYMVTEKPMIAEIKTAGNKKVSNSDLLAALPFKAKEVLNLKKLKDGVEKLQKLYEERGYYAVDVEYRLQELPERQVNITYNIQEHEKVNIRTISFKGNKVFSDKELRKVITTKEKGFFSFFTGSGVLNRERLKTDREILAEHYADFGYIKAAVGEPEVKIDKQGIYITFPIDEGLPYKVGKLELKGELISPEEELRKRLKLISGQTFGRGRLVDDIRSLTEFYTDRGFAYANVTPTTRINEEDKSIDVVFDIDKSRKMFVERINIAGNTTTRDKVIRRYVTLAEGDRFSGSALTTSRRRVDSLGYFKKVEVSTSKGSSPDLLNMDVKVAEAPTGSFAIGAGVSTREGPSVFGEVRQNNFLGRGIRLSGRAQLGGVSKLFEISHFDPSFLDSKFALTTELFNTFQDFRDFNRDSAGGLFRFSYPLSPLWLGGLGYRLERVKLSSISESASPLLLPERGASIVSAPYFDLVRDTRDFPTDPSEGSLYRFSTEIAGGVFGGDNDFAKFVLDGRKFFPFSLWKRTAVFMARGQAGYIHPFAGQRVRVFERFFLGGMDSVRGYQSFAIGPRDAATGTILGGTKELLLNLELVYPIWSQFNLKGVLFFDAGNSFAAGEGLNPTDLRKSIGFGVRFQSPVGPIRLEYGIALDRQKKDPMGKLEFQLGR